MDIFYVSIEKFLNKIDKNYLLSFCDNRNFSSQKNLVEHCIGRFLVQNISKFFYNLDDTKVILKNKKPVFENGKIHFSISHSNNYVFVVFDKNPCGIDVEYMKKINLENFSKRYNKNFKNEEEFYKFWTTLEANIKLQCDLSYTYSDIFDGKYMFTVVSNKIINKLPRTINYLELKGQSYECFACE